VLRRQLLNRVKNLEQSKTFGIQSALQRNHPANHNTQTHKQQAKFHPQSPERTAPMSAIFHNLMNDEAGFIISAELVLVASIAVLAMIVGLSEVALNVANELEDVGSSFGSITQSYIVNGICGHMGNTSGSFFKDTIDFCDGTCDIESNMDRTGEGPLSH
jgi:hypothetical protein